MASGPRRKLPASFSSPPLGAGEPAGDPRPWREVHLHFFCRMFCLALTKARMSESVWLSPVRGTDDVGLSGMLGTSTRHTSLQLVFGLSTDLPKVLFHLQ